MMNFLLKNLGLDKTTYEKVDDVLIVKDLTIYMAAQRFMSFDLCILPKTLIRLIRDYCSWV